MERLDYRCSDQGLTGSPCEGGYPEGPANAHQPGRGFDTDERGRDGLFCPPRELRPYHIEGLR